MGFENDKLNREKYSDFLTEIITNPEKYKRISDSKSLTIAIDSGWGTGKTTFIDMWMDKLSKLKDDNEKNKYVIVKYNAWKNDFVEEPLESIVYNLVKNDSFFDSIEEKDMDNAKKGIIRTVGSLAKATTVLIAKNKVGEDFGEFVDSALNNFKNIKEVVENYKNSKNDITDFYENYEKYLTLIETLRNDIKKLLNGRQLIFIVDELDRCKPLFAIKLLENIKHIFDINEACFVFALDMEQLSHSIKCIYGQGMDANGYLSRFFDYISKMPKPDIQTYIDFLMSEKAPLRSELFNFNGNIDEKNLNVRFIDVFEELAIKMNLSLRDINTVYSNFIIFESLELKEVECCQAYTLYLFLMMLKYKNLSLFNSVLEINNQKSYSVNDVLTPYVGKFLIRKQIELFNNNIKIKNLKIKIFDSNWGTYDVSDILKVDSNSVKIRYGLERYITTYKIDSRFNISNILFCNDIINYDNIKEKTVKSFLQEKLEFFNFENKN